MRRSAFAAGVVGLVGVAALVAHVGPERLPFALTKGDGRATGPAGSATSRSGSTPEHNPPRPLRVPTGAPVAVDCRGVRKVVRQARALLAASPRPVDPKSFGEAVADWLDPHGLWSVAPDSPVGPAVSRRARDLLHEIESSPADAPCPVASELGRELGSWVAELRGEFTSARRGAVALAPGAAFAVASSLAFEDGTSPRPARELATELGKRTGQVRASYGEALEEASRAAAERVVPDRATPWAELVLAAALRAYLPQIDPHGGWAPFEEETSLYEVDLEAAPPARLWRRMTRTAVGVRVDEEPLTPLLVGDVVLSVDDVATAGLSLEQADQLALLDDEGASGVTKTVVVLRQGESAPRRLAVTAPDEGGGGGSEGGGALDAQRVRYGDGDVLVVPLGDVPDDLGEALSATIARARAERPPVGIVLDLRGNGGGSTDGANGALGLFLPGAKLFPLHRRDGTIEVERAPTPPPAERWAGPVATLVDGDTASAAEMIAGALVSYRRGPVVGSRTYGKGCAQEYLDDEAGSGVLRLTTLLYALPDGSAVQRTGIGPSIKLALPRTTEREAVLTHSLSAWQGPDVRDAALVREVPWPGHNGSVGPCDDQVLCKALRALGAPRTPVARETSKP